VIFYAAIGGAGKICHSCSSFGSDVATWLSLSLSFFLSVFQLCAVLLAANLPAAN